MDRQTLQLKEIIFGKEYPDILININNLVLSFRQQNKYIEAETIDRQIL
jgi:hypothetical protein